MLLHRLSLLALALLALLLPFELETPWLTLGPVVLTNVELLLWAVLGLTALTAWQSARQGAAGAGWPKLPRAWLLLLGLSVLGLLVSSALAPAYRGNALKATLRTLSGLALMGSVVVLVRSRRDLRWVVGGLLGGGLAAAALGLAEIVRNAEYGLLRAFRPGPTAVGPFLRLTGPFDYANQTAMFFEATLPLLVVLGWALWRRGKTAPALLAGVAFILVAEAAILTLSRTSFATLIAANLIVALILWLRQRAFLPSAALFAGAAAAIAILIGVNGLFNPVFRLRFSSESDTAWYMARLDVPDELNLAAGEARQVQVTVANDGVFTWRSIGSRPVRLAARWTQPENALQLQSYPRWPLAGPLASGESQTLTIELQAPREAGQYLLVWDLVQENVTWFSAKTGIEGTTAVTVTGVAPPVADESWELGLGTFEAAWEIDPPIPGRRTLWQAAYQLWRGRPLMGIGLDNYRLRYGEVLGYQSWNRTIHTNNWYIETMVSLGLLGAVPFFAWLGLLVWGIVRGVGRAGAQLWPAAVAAGLLAYLVHGLLDYFLLFNATGLLFWLLAGLWVRLAGDQGVAVETEPPLPPA